MKRTSALLGTLLVVGGLFVVGATVAVVADAPVLTPTEELGKAIFFDENLSLNANQSCATCHGPEAGWTGPVSAINAHGAVYEGSIPGAFGDRKPPSSAYATFSPVLHVEEDGLWVGGNFWDGRATGWRLGSPAAEQAQGPFLNPKEQALAAPADVVSRVCAAAYGDLFRTVWGADTCNPANVDAAYDAIAFSIAAYEGSPESNAFTSKYDAYLAGLTNLTKEEKRGLHLFQSKGKCAKCHVLNRKKDDSPALFTDFTFDNLGLPKNPENPVYYDNPGFVDPGLGGFLAAAGYEDEAEENMGKHKVPTLRNVGRGPDGLVKAYGHNGYFKSLEGIVHFYNTRDLKPACPGDYTEAQALAAGCWPAPEVPENVNTAELGSLNLTPAQEADLVAFMRTLSDGYLPPPAAGARWRFGRR
jgi:cytochrome c peroxidase